MRDALAGPPQHARRQPARSRRLLAGEDIARKGADRKRGRRRFEQELPTRGRSIRCS